ncbi:G patch domain and ankyrin repeat-containing protein 1 [Rhizoclosmatium hyalinum]|nr:G patch domain and ankyrin repeat-containing protein 1 [Rhizoclosmatium hyalinum]
MEPNQWRKYTFLSGDDKVVRFEASSRTDSESVKARAQEVSECSSASIYRQIITSDIPIQQHSNPQFVKRIKRIRKTMIQSRSSQSKGDESGNDDEATLNCELCKTSVPASKLEVHQSQTCHLLSRLEVEGLGVQPMIYAFSEKDRGYQMLKKQGWKHGDALGVDESMGLKLPVAPQIKRDKVGIGASKATSASSVMKRVGDTFRKPVSLQLAAIELQKKVQGEGTGVVKRRRAEILQDAQKSREKGLALLAYLND